MVLVNDWEPVACRVGTPCRYSSPSRERDDALARARATGDDHDLLVVGLFGPAHGVEHHAVRDLLLVEEDELLAFAHLLGGDGHQLPGRDRLAGEEFVGRAGARVLGAQLGAEVVDERPPAPGGVELSPVVGLDLAQAADAEFGGVVEVGDTTDALRVLGDRAVEVDEVLAVTTDLFDGVEDRASVRVDVAQRRVVLVRCGLAPLLQLDHDVRRFSGDRVHSGEHGVGALAVQRQRVLQHDLHATEAGLGECRGQHRDAPFPGADLGEAWSVAVRVDELLGETQEERAVERHDGDRLGGLTEQQGKPPGSTEELVRVGACPSKLHGSGAEARRAAMTM
ncbi:hypothetical protein GCM10010405_42270 [Streptomyces macrosporus]|uniref:Uncharacterized protein n=1 Tax=Streptomyces macrosporus TaxID=44032 RepID=A0ABN3KE63_9ACTN